MKATHAQLAKIHIAKKELNLDEADYRNVIRFYGCEHANDLQFDEAEELIAKLNGAGANVVRTQIKMVDDCPDEYGKGKERYTMLDGRGKPYPKSSKLRKIEALWATVSNTKSRKSLMIFVENKTGKSHLAFIVNKDANLLLTILESMEEHHGGTESQR